MSLATVSSALKAGWLAGVTHLVILSHHLMSSLCIYMNLESEKQFHNIYPKVPGSIMTVMAPFPALGYTLSDSNLSQWKGLPGASPRQMTENAAHCSENNQLQKSLWCMQTESEGLCNCWCLHCFDLCCKLGKRKEVRWLGGEWMWREAGNSRY